jgi:Zn-dependent protease with chaperone function
LNFFEHQSLARRNSRVMVLLFLLAVAAVVVCVDVVVGCIWLWGRGQPLAAPLAAVPQSVYAWGAIATAGMVFVVSLVSVARLGGGGATVAEMAGGRRIAANSADPLERRVLNVVAEMAIASGVRVPQVYVLDGERGINAFAAGWDASSAVIAVTRGALDTLSRDELQGVVGHEFSHILNGDMRLNIRMLGVLAGIVFIGSIGSFLMRNTDESSDSRAVAVAFAAGLALFVVGYVGLFFARLIKAAVGRQREFLADAAAVQFTRNPDGLCGALDQIRCAAGGALISSRAAEDLSHMFFGESIRMRLGGLLATHPPLDERIERINPKFEPSGYAKKRQAVDAAPAASEAAIALAGDVAPNGRRAADAGVAWGRSPEAAAGLVGKLDAGKLDYATRLLAALPAPLREAVRHADSAAAAMIALLIASKEEVMLQQLEAVKRATTLAGQVEALLPATRGLGLGFHLPVIDLALAALKSAPESTKKQAIAGLEAAAYADRRVSLHEFVVLTLVREQLTPRTKPGAATKKVGDLQGAAAVVLALVAQAGTRADAAGAREEALRAAQRSGAKVLGIAEEAVAKAALTLDAARGALEELKGLAPMQKEVLVKGLFAAVTADGTVRVAEAGLMRLVGAVLDCPLPPLIAELDPASLQI